MLAAISDDRRPLIGAELDMGKIVLVRWPNCHLTLGHPCRTESGPAIGEARYMGIPRAEEEDKYAHLRPSDHGAWLRSSMTGKRLTDGGNLVATLLRSLHATCFVAERDGRMIGCLASSSLRRTEGEALIRFVGVHSHKGVGLSLYETSYDVARAGGRTLCEP